MKLNSISPGAGSKKPRLRVGRGASAGQGKTCGRGVKGQRARKGGYHKGGFEGGQMPIARRASAVLVTRLVIPQLPAVRALRVDSTRRRSMTMPWHVRKQCHGTPTQNESPSNISREVFPRSRRASPSGMHQGAFSRKL